MNHRILKAIFCFTFLFAIYSCGESSTAISENDGSKKQLKDSIAAESPDTIPNVNPRQFLFERLVHRMDSLGYDPDTTYFDETMYLEESIHYANYETYFIHGLLIDEKNYGDLISVGFNKEYDERFARVKDIRLYPWRMPDTPEGRMRSGVVELWTFGNTTDAEFVQEFLEEELKYSGFPFIKTRPYYFQCGQWVFMFHSPDSGVSYRHEQFYEWIKKECHRNRF